MQGTATLRRNFIFCVQQILNYVAIYKELQQVIVILFKICHLC